MGLLRSSFPACVLVRPGEIQQWRSPLPWWRLQRSQLDERDKVQLDLGLFDLRLCESKREVFSLPPEQRPDRGPRRPVWYDRLHNVRVWLQPSDREWATGLSTDSSSLICSNSSRCPWVHKISGQKGARWLQLPYFWTKLQVPQPEEIFHRGQCHMPGWGRDSDPIPHTSTVESFPFG